MLKHKVNRGSADKEAPPRKTLLAYGALNLPLMITDLPVLVYLPAFYTQELGLNVGIVGILFMLARFVDGLSDPLVGWISDNTSSRLGRRKPWIVCGVPLLMVSTWYLCLPVDGVGYLYLACWVILFYISQTIVRIPYWSWGAEISLDYKIRNKVVGYREAFGMLGNILVAAVPLLLLPKGSPVGDVLYLIVGMVLISLLLTAIPLAKTVPDNQYCVNKENLGFSKGLKLFLLNIPFITFLMATIFLSIYVGIANSLFLFMVDVGWGIPGTFLSLLLVQYSAAILALPLHISLANRFGKHVVFSGAMVGLMLVIVLFFLAPRGNYLFIVVLQIISGLAFSSAFIFPTSILADIIDFDSAHNRVERAGFFMAAYNLTLKLGLAIGVGIAYGYLELIGYDPTLVVHNASDIFNLRAGFSGISILVLIPVFVLWWKFPLDRKVQEKLRAIIENRSRPIEQIGKISTGNRDEPNVNKHVSTLSTDSV